MKFKESELAHLLLDGLRGIEIGGSAHNPFGLNTLNVDYCDRLDTPFKQAEISLCGEALKVDIVAYGDDLPFKDKTFDFVISSHTIEHIFDPIKAMKEWIRVVKPGGIIFTIAPITSFVPGETRPTTTIEELIDRHNGVIKEDEIIQRIADKNHDDNILGSEIVNGILYDTKHGHWTVFDTDLFSEMCAYLGVKIIAAQEVDDKVGNGFTVVVKVDHELTDQEPEGNSELQAPNSEL